MKRSLLLTATLLMLSVMNLSFISGCGEPAAPESTPQEIEKSRQEHRERSRRERLEG